MDPVVHFEMPYDDRRRMAKFYASAFGWQTQLLDEDMGHYVLATTAETDEQGPKTPGAINGGFFPRKPDWPAQHPSIVIAVKDIQDSVRRVTEAGGTVLGEPMAIPGVGQYVSFTDTDVIGLTTIAATVGPRWTGLLSPFPVFALVLGAFTHRTQGAGAAAHLLRGVVLGSLAHATMFVLVAHWLISYGVVWTYGWASLSAIAVNGLALVVMNHVGRRRGAVRV